PPTRPYNRILPQFAVPILYSSDCLRPPILGLWIMTLNYRPGNRNFKYEMSISCQPPPVAQPNMELNPPLTALVRILDIDTNEAITIEEEPNSIWAMAFPVNEDKRDIVLSSSTHFFNRSTCDSVHPLDNNSGYVAFPYLSFNKEGLYRLQIS